MIQIVDAPDGFEVPAQFTAGPRLTQRFPALFPLAVAVFRARRHLVWARSGARWTTTRSATDLPHLHLSHRSILLRELRPDLMWLQHNKVHNLRLAAAHLDGLLIRPGETFSFNKVVGVRSRRRGYIEGLNLNGGTAEPGVGGGVCQVANLLHWMVLHSPLTVVERSEHSHDPFPDSGRVIPWGVGCTIAYNYVDFVIRNDTTSTFQLRVRVGPTHLEGELRSDEAPSAQYAVAARGERFIRVGDRFFRENQIWRTVVDPSSGATVREELVKRNVALVLYRPDEVGDEEPENS